MMKRVVLKNFMCHDNFEISLNPRINFISGQNGSGKSAIVAALMIGLGQRASVTNRGHSVKDFIKRGKHQAVIEITFCNAGENAYEKASFGNELTIVRKITETTSSYILRDERGDCKVCNHDKLNTILLHFNVQPNNPLCILSQDVARSFFLKFDPKSMYSLYVKATLLEKTYENYAESKESTKRNDKILARHKDDLEKLKKEVQQVEKRKQQAEQYSKLEKKKSELEIEMLWADVNVKSAELDEKNELLVSLISEKEKIENQLKSKTETVLDDKMRQLQNSLMEVQQKISDADNEQKSTKQSICVLKSELDDAKGRYVEQNNVVKKKKEDIRKLQTEIEKLQNKNIPELQRQTDELRQLKETMVKIEATVRTTDVHNNQLQDTLDNCKSIMASNEQDIRKINSKINETKDKMKMLNEGKNLGIYGKWMPLLLDEIEKAHKRGQFSEKPRGPLGAYIEVLDSKWAATIEQLLKAQLFMFCVNTINDKKVFHSIAERCGVPRNNIPGTVTSKFIHKVYDISRNETHHERYSNVFRKLNISDPVVANCLIDQMELEKILLVQTVDEALLLSEDINHVPRNCKYCFTLTADTIYPQPNYRVYAGKMRSNDAMLLQVDRSEFLRSLEKNLNSLQQNFLKLQEDRSAVIKEKQRIEIEKKKVENSLLQLSQNLKAIRCKKVSLETKVDFEPVNVELYSKDIESCELDLQKAEQNEKDLLAVIKAKELVVIKGKDKLKELTNSKTPLSEEKTQILADLQRMEKKIKEKETCQAKLKSIMERQLAKETELKAAVTKLTKDLEESQTNAVGARQAMQTNRRTEEVSKELKSVNSKLEALKAVCQNDSVELAAEDYEKKCKSLRKASRYLKQLEYINERQHLHVDNGVTSFHQTEKTESDITKKAFPMLLKTRDLQGSIEVDHEKELLKLNIVRGKEKGTGKKGEISSLSGGERSFATNAFIATVWNSMAVPFFVMDEFDVFTDVITRKAILKLLLDYALMREAQFIFVTPLDVSRIDTNNGNVSVHRVSNPRKE